MSRRYDSRTTIFSPEGRLYQVEYALEAISHAGTAIGVLATDGIALVAERKTTSKLLEQLASTEKVYVLNENTICAVAGMTADAAILIDYVRQVSQEYLKVYNSEPPLEHLVKKVCNFKQGYTQFGGLRPFGVSFIFAGYDDRHGLQLYTSNPSGNYSGWRAASIGANSASAQTMLKQEIANASTSASASTSAEGAGAGAGAGAAGNTGSDATATPSATSTTTTTPPATSTTTATASGDASDSDSSGTGLTLDAARALALRVLAKTTDSTQLTAERLEVATVAVGPAGVQLRVWTPAEVAAVLPAPEA